MKSLSPRQFFLVQNVADVGNVKVGTIFFDSYGELEHYPSIQPFNTVLVPVFKIEQIDNEFYLKSGYIDIETNFFNCPILISYILMDTIIFNSVMDTFEASVKVFDRDLKNFKIRKVVGRDGDDIRGSFINLFKILNLINLNIDRGYNTDDINFENIKRKDLHYRNKNEIIIEEVNSLCITYFEEGIYIPQKDNYFSVEAEIKNLPNNPYLLKVISNSLTKFSKEVSAKDKLIKLVLETDRYSAPSFERRVMADSKYRVERLKDLLKIDIAQDFDMIEYRLAKLIE